MSGRLSFLSPVPISDSDSDAGWRARGSAPGTGGLLVPSVRPGHHCLVSCLVLSTTRNQARDQARVSKEPAGLDFEPAGLDFEPAGLELKPVGLELEPAGLEFGPNLA